MKFDRRLHIGECRIVSVALTNDDAFQSQRIRDETVGMSFDDDLHDGENVAEGTEVIVDAIIKVATYAAAPFRSAPCRATFRPLDRSDGYALSLNYPS